MANKGVLSFLLSRNAPGSFTFPHAAPSLAHYGGVSYPYHFINGKGWNLLNHSSHPDSSIPTPIPNLFLIFFDRDPSVVNAHVIG